MRVQDAGVDRVVRQFEARGRPINDTEVLTLLAELADRTPSESAAMLKALSREGITRAEQFALVKDGLDPDELQDLKSVLDESFARFSPAARNLLEALVGRAPLNLAAPLLQLDRAASNGLSGLSAPGAVLEAINLSTAATGLGRVTDTVELGRADERGRFQVFMGEVQQGDQVRVRARSPDGQATDWFTVAANEQGQVDRRAAFVNLKRVLLRSSPDGTVSVLPASKDLPFTEPFATVRFKNERTAEFVDVTMGDFATLTAPVVLAGQPGDVISVAVSDGGGNTDLSFVSGSLTAPGVAPRGNLVDPAPLRRDGQPATFRADGVLFVDGASARDPKQGQIGNCYVPAGLAAVANANPEAIAELITANDDGSVTVRFFDPVTFEPQEIVVDRDLYGSGDRPRYGSFTQRDGAGHGEAWFSLVEKAYAQWKGGYEVVAAGGSVGRLQAEVLGRPNVEHWLSGASPAEVFGRVQQGTREGRAMAAGTFGTADAARYTGTGIHANHAYTVLGASEEHGRQLITLRNPWASGEPTGDGVDDGVFELPVEDFVRLFQVLNVC